MEICPHRIKIETDNLIFTIPACWNFNIDQHNKTINSVVIVIHGVLRNADTYFENMMTAAYEADHAEHHTLIIAPQFLIEEDIETFELNNDVLFWGGETGEGWKRGDDSLNTDKNPRMKQFSSFKIIDILVERVANSDSFPNVQQIIVVGHSAGGQFVNRYAAGTQIGNRVAEGISLKFIVANPSSYIYFDGKRRIPGTPDRFDTPPENTDPGYNHYKYGLDNLNNYMEIMSAEGIIAQYPQQNVIYLLGGDDNNLEDEHLEKSDPANLQGEHRLARGLVYKKYLQNFFGEKLGNRHQFFVILGVGHDHAGIFISDIGRQCLFGK